MYEEPCDCIVGAKLVEVKEEDEEGWVDVPCVALQKGKYAAYSWHRLGEDEVSDLPILMFFGFRPDEENQH